MNFFLTFDTAIIPKDVSTGFSELMQKEIAAQDPAQGVKLLNSDGSDQLRFNFTDTKKIVS